ncbi:MAG: UDP-D-galactose:(glucosyl)lipopolysaccharide-1,6-D-galactosyltransferase [Methanocella sp. PtaU1.Bin125]|nr:MAG: UDP-D-galactose:(glucosyl)lipopolysaccharide-1,6-D-galactosyltransferase [Methanocella sp. PtaU1.Bin125]
MKNVLMIAPLPWNIGGVEKRIAEIARNLDDRIRLVIVTSSASDREVGEHRWNGANVVVLKRTRHFPYYPVGIFRYLRRHRDDFDLVDIQGLKTIEPLVFLLSGMRKPFIVTPHHHARASSRLFQLLKTFYDPLVGRRLLEQARQIICVSDVEKGLIRDDFGPHLLEKATVICNGINLAEIRSAGPFDVDGDVVLYVGRLEKYKNVQLLIESMRHLPVTYRLFVIGEGSYRKSLEQLAGESNLEDRVTFLGRISEQDVYRWLKTSKVFANLSDLEAFGISVIEALAAGTPAVVNDRYGLGEIARKFPGAVFPVNVKHSTPGTIARAIESASMNGPVGLEPYEWSRIAAEIGEVYLAYTN